ncbi:hypothetical protein C8J57DRAFT_1715700 [Mycena rebaudengoi]|nr:hypothetical protein C8J57DRAFT_1715700 [Mycena rebaudengoi]
MAYVCLRRPSSDQSVLFFRATPYRKPPIRMFSQDAESVRSSSGAPIQLYFASLVRSFTGSNISSVIIALCAYGAVGGAVWTTVSIRFRTSGRFMDSVASGIKQTLTLTAVLGALNTQALAFLTPHNEQIYFVWNIPLSKIYTTGLMFVLNSQVPEPGDNKSTLRSGITVTVSEPPQSWLRRQ